MEFGDHLSGNVFVLQVHKLVASSTYLMYPGHLNLSQYPTASAVARAFNCQQSALDYSSLNDGSSFGAVGSSSGSSRPSQSTCENCDNSAREKVSGPFSIPCSQNSDEIAMSSEVSGNPF